MTLQDIMNNRDYKSFYVLARYFYRIGEPIISDSNYDQLEAKLKVAMPYELKEYFERTYDDDPVPKELLKSLGIEPVKFLDLSQRSEFLASLNEDKSLSIESAKSYEEAWEFFCSLRENKQDFMASLKIDGDNTKMLYTDDTFTLSMSRGRAGASFDFTDQSAKVVPHTIKSGQKHLMVFGESYVESEGLEVLRKYYGKGYKTCKSAAVSMLRVRHRTEHYKYLHTKVFFADGLSDTLSGMFTALEAQGVETPPHKLFEWSAIPETFEAFKVWLKSSVFDYFEVTGAGIPSDGIVVEVNDLLWLGEQKNQYSNRQLALKFEQWSFKYEKGVITRILVEQRRVFKSVRVEIEPVVQYDGCTATIINAFNPAVLISTNLNVGEVVHFKKDSGAVNILVHGKELRFVVED